MYLRYGDKQCWTEVLPGKFVNDFYDFLHNFNVIRLYVQIRQLNEQRKLHDATKINKQGLRFSECLGARKASSWGG